MHLRTKGKKNSGQEEPENGDATSASAFSVKLGELVADRSAERTASSHGQKRQSAVESADLQVQAANFGKINEEPAKENPSDIAEAEIAEGEREDFLA